MFDFNRIQSLILYQLVYWIFHRRIGVVYFEFNTFTLYVVSTNLGDIIACGIMYNVMKITHEQIVRQTSFHIPTWKLTRSCNLKIFQLTPTIDYRRYQIVNMVLEMSVYLMKIVQCRERRGRGFPTVLSMWTMQTTSRSKHAYTCTKTLTASAHRVLAQCRRQQDIDTYI
jgi:hypothetical protein